MKEIIEGNILIAQYMGIPKCQRCDDCGSYQYGPGIIFLPKEMEYSQKWDWLMPVILKIISEHKTDFFIDKMSFDNFFIGLGTDGTYSQNELHESAIMASYEAVIGFIKYLNKHTNENTH